MKRKWASSDGSVLFKIPVMSLIIRVTNKPVSSVLVVKPVLFLVVKLVYVLKGKRQFCVFTINLNELLDNLILDNEYELLDRELADNELALDD